MGIIYGFVLLYGIGLPGEYANNETVSQWWHYVLVAVLAGGVAALVALALPKLVGQFAMGTAIGSVIGLIGAPFWHHTNQEPGLATTLVVSLLVLGLAKKTLNQRAFDSTYPPLPTAPIEPAQVLPYLQKPSVAPPVRTVGRPQDRNGPSV